MTDHNKGTQLSCHILEFLSPCLSLRSWWQEQLGTLLLGSTWNPGLTSAEIIMIILCVNPLNFPIRLFLQHRPVQLPKIFFPRPSLPFPKHTPKIQHTQAHTMWIFSKPFPQCLPSGVARFNNNNNNKNTSTQLNFNFI